MYRPVPPRPKQTSIVRTRTGCRNCRRRRKKCDENKPACTACIRLGRRCEGYAIKLEFRSVSFRPTAPRDHQEQMNNSQIPPDSFLQLDMMRPSKEFFYMGIWETQCAPSLHPVFRELTRLQDLSPVIVDTMMALAARQLSRLLPQAREFGPLNNLSLCFRPDISQQSISGEFSSSAMRGVAQWTESYFYSDSITALVVLTLFCYLESLMSNFRGFYLHSDAVRTLLGIHRNFISQLSGYKQSLFAAWVQSQMHNWWRRFHFATAAFHRDHPPLVAQPMLWSLSALPDSRVSVLMILCESYRLSAATFMFYSNDAMEIQLTTSPSPPKTRQSPSTRPCVFLSTQEQQLNYQRDALSDWYDRLSPSELPTDVYVADHSSVSCKPDPLQILPLRFNSHGIAMNFAYYVTARVLQCVELFNDHESNGGQADIDRIYKRAEPWIMILLRIAAGIDWEACVRLNTYTIGLSGLLLACALRSNNSALTFWVQDWLSKRYHEGCLEEGSFPIFQIAQVLQIINAEKASGRHVHAVCQSVDDGGGTGKFDSYVSQRLETVLTYGWCIKSNRFYSRRLVLTSTTPPPPIYRGAAQE
ncbi:hypothetical protein F4805DRAFT_440689 [Annulohypoxylon moriforme]|nr:hypothetical protein F4805DRAFT_440689 [Annulohypoxylon moriforme]